MSLIEVLLATALAATLVGIAVPVTSSALDDLHTAGAARHVASRISAARIDAVTRSAAAAIRFEPVDGDYVFTSFLDGNGNGVRTADIRTGTDPATSRGERLRDNYAGVRFGLKSGIPDLDGTTGIADGVRIGAARILSLSPNGSATSGTIYLHGRRAQFAIRVLGATGRTRVFEYDEGARTWTSR
jgi:type II secretory pathway pseudopilin PulG